MIARSWVGRTRLEDADEYLRYVLGTGVAEHRQTPGNRGSWVLRRAAGDVAEFIVISFWDSTESIKAFAGPDIEAARYYDEDERFLLEMSPTVTHYEMAPHSDGE